MPQILRCVLGLISLSLLGIIGIGDFALASTTQTLYATQDSFLSKIAKNTNLGGKEKLEIQKFGKNRTLVNFDLSHISLDGLAKASLVLTIKGQPVFWPKKGRLVMAHPLRHSWAEGNGSSWFRRGKGTGVTWNCKTDTRIQNRKKNCSKSERWKGGKYAPASGPGVMHSNSLSGEVVWDVTADVQSGVPHGWLLKKAKEKKWGWVKYYSKEGAEAMGNPKLSPRLILEYESTPPEVTSISPNTGPSGTFVIISGANFSEGAQVTVGDTPAPGVTLLSKTQLGFLVPLTANGNEIAPFPAGPVSVQVDGSVPLEFTVTELPFNPNPPGVVLGQVLNTLIAEIQVNGPLVKLLLTEQIQTANDPNLITINTILLNLWPILESLITSDLSDLLGELPSETVAILERLLLPNFDLFVSASPPGAMAAPQIVKLVDRGPAIQPRLISSHSALAGDEFLDNRQPLIDTLKPLDNINRAIDLWRTACLATPLAAACAGSKVISTAIEITLQLTQTFLNYGLDNGGKVVDLFIDVENIFRAKVLTAENFKRQITANIVVEVAPLAFFLELGQRIIEASVSIANLSEVPDLKVLDALLTLKEGLDALGLPINEYIKSAPPDDEFNFLISFSRVNWEVCYGIGLAGCGIRTTNSVIVSEVSGETFGRVTRIKFEPGLFSEDKEVPIKFNLQDRYILNGAGEKAEVVETFELGTVYKLEIDITGAEEGVMSDQLVPSGPMECQENPGDAKYCHLYDYVDKANTATPRFHMSLKEGFELDTHKGVSICVFSPTIETCSILMNSNRRVVFNIESLAPPPVVCKPGDEFDRDVLAFSRVSAGDRHPNNGQDSVVSRGPGAQSAMATASWTHPQDPTLHGDADATSQVEKGSGSITLSVSATTDSNAHAQFQWRETMIITKDPNFPPGDPLPAFLEIPQIDFNISSSCSGPSERQADMSFRLRGKDFSPQYVVISNASCSSGGEPRLAQPIPYLFAQPFTLNMAAIANVSAAFSRSPLSTGTVSGSFSVNPSDFEEANPGLKFEFCREEP